MPATFELKANDDNAFHFDYVDKNEDIILMSGHYPDKDTAEKAIGAVRVGSLMSHQLAAGKDNDGKSFFVIKNAEGDILVKSILFESQMLFDNALHSVKDNACIAEIKDLT